ncbi:MAG: TraG/TraD/VirD4 family protein [Defluviitaleaceae bacterium]|nr:TraG/TraD/VirD4 family protein [Defluviitaleaceae bacterium]
MTSKAYLSLFPKIPNFLEMLAYARSLNVGIIPIFQSTVQAQKMYEKDWETIVDSCDTFLYLGGAKSNFTTEYVAKLLGKETIDMQLYSASYRQGKTTNQNVSAVARDLLTPDEVGRIKKRESILRIGDISPIITPKFDLKKHPNYKELADTKADVSSAIYDHTVPERKTKDVYVVEFEFKVKRREEAHELPAGDNSSASARPATDKGYNDDNF